MFGEARRFRALLAGNIEGIASNILADRLARLVANGLLSRQGDLTHRQRVIYGLTEAAIELVPMMAVMGARGLRQRTPTVELAIRARLLEDGGPELWAAFMGELRHRHLGDPEPVRSVLAELQAAFEVVARGARV